jgi:hypothetical protein
MDSKDTAPPNAAAARIQAWFDLRYSMLELLGELEYLALMLKLGVKVK